MDTLFSQMARERQHYSVNLEGLSRLPGARLTRVSLKRKCSKVSHVGESFYMPRGVRGRGGDGLGVGVRGRCGGGEDWVSRWQLELRDARKVTRS